MIPKTPTNAPTAQAHIGTLAKVSTIDHMGSGNESAESMLRRPSDNPTTQVLSLRS